MDCSPPGSSVHGISQARILEWIAISFSRGYSQLMDHIHVSCISRQILHHGKYPLFAEKQTQGSQWLCIMVSFIIISLYITKQLIIEINVMCLNHSKTITLNPTPGPWKNYLLWNQSLVPKRLGTAGLPVIVHKSNQEWIEGIEISGQCGELI